MTADHGAGRAGALLACAAAMALGACGSDNDPGPGGVTVGEARALDDAAEMLEQQRLPQTATPTPSPPADDASPAASENGA